MSILCIKRFTFFNVFILSTFLFFKNVHWKFHQEVREARLKPRKRINGLRVRFIVKVAGCRAALNPLRIYYVRQCILPIATRLLWHHAVGGVRFVKSWIATNWTTFSLSLVPAILHPAMSRNTAQTTDRQTDRHNTVAYTTVSTAG